MKNRSTLFCFQTGNQDNTLENSTRRYRLPHTKDQERSSPTWANTNQKTDRAEIPFLPTADVLQPMCKEAIHFWLGSLPRHTSAPVLPANHLWTGSLVSTRESWGSPHSRERQNPHMLHIHSLLKLHSPTAIISWKGSTSKVTLTFAFTMLRIDKLPYANWFF